MSGKAQKDTTTSSGNQSKWKRHPDLYMEDGSVVLVAGDTLFRVYLHWLAKKSEVFANLLSFGKVQPEDSEKYEGCPLVRVSDNPKDMEYFLYSLDACSDYFFPGCPTSFDATAAILRLSTKYMITRLREKAIDHLCRLYPVRFEEMRTDHKAISAEVFGPGGAPEHPIFLVNLVRECNVTKLLPWGCYAVIRWSFRDMVIGHKCSDDTMVKLSEQDKQTCLLGYESLLGIQHTNIKAIFVGPSAKCQTASCEEAIEDAFRRALDEHGTGLIAPLGPLRRKISACDRCIANIHKLDLEKRKEVWNNLPESFSLPPWSELLKDENEDRTKKSENKK